MTVKKGKIDFSKVVTQEMRDAEQFANLCNTVRDTRDGLLQEVVWMLDRHRDENDLKGQGVINKTSLNTDQITELRLYVQQLRNVPQQETFPDNVKWPDKPAFLE